MPNSARRAAWAALAAFADGSALRIDGALDVRGLASREQALALEIARGAVRRQRLLDHVLAPLCARGLPESGGLRAALRAGAYQLLFLERVPPHAAVDETVRLVGPRERGFVNAVLRRVATAVRDEPADPERPTTQLALSASRALHLEAPLPDPELDPVGHLHVRHGVPRFVLERWLARYGVAGAAALGAAADRTPGVHLRPVRTARDQLATRLAAEGVETQPSEHPRLLEWTGGASPFATAVFRAGGFVVQDRTAVRAAEAVGAQPGETILDLCAAPGTKATLLAEAVGPDGRVIAFDVDVARRGRITDNALRLAMPWLQVVADTSQLADFDRVLVDVPCSNTGVLARRVEVRHRLVPAAIDNLARLQTELLLRGLELVRPGGTAVYATCSIEPEEGDAVVDAAAAAADAEVIARVATLPDPPRHDGGYHAVLIRRTGRSHLATIRTPPGPGDPGQPRRG